MIIKPRMWDEKIASGGDAVQTMVLVVEHYPCKAAIIQLWSLPKRFHHLTLQGCDGKQTRCSSATHFSLARLWKKVSLLSQSWSFPWTISCEKRLRALTGNEVVTHQGGEMDEWCNDTHKDIVITLCVLKSFSNFKPFHTARRFEVVRLLYLCLKLISYVQITSWTVWKHSYEHRCVPKTETKETWHLS